MLKRILLLLTSMVSAITIPYNPSTAFLSSDSSVVYLFNPTQDGTTFQLSAISLTSTISSTQTNSTTIASTLPFTPRSTTALVASIDTNNKIYLIAGDCAQGARNAQLWTIDPATQNPGWNRVQTSAPGVQSPSANGGVNMLSGAMNFNERTYIFGGMCPNSSSLSIDNWQASGSYSNSLLSVTSSGSIAQIVTRGPPIPEAGFSITPLEAAYLNTSKSIANQQNFVLLGGQTQSAFINTSQVAVFSLPEESWSFASVDPSASPISIDPRSGHAAALSSDGKTIFVSGGWVGDVHTAAEPQFMSLNIGSGYGGSGRWSWSVPTQTNDIPNLYGHSMVVLPGNILMISGGYSLASGSSRRKRQASNANSDTYFYNTSSNSWITSYTNPNVLAAASSTLSTSSSLSNSTKIGLGVGLGIGLGLLLLVIFCIWFGRRKIREHRRNRDRRLLQQSMSAVNGPLPFGTEPISWMAENDRPAADPYPWAPTHGDADSIRRASQAERTGLVYDIPSPTRGLRRSLSTRPAGYRNEGHSRTHGRISTIAETDESEKGTDHHDVVTTAPVLDPFQDPIHLLDRRSPSPVSPAVEREKEMKHWYQDWATAEKAQQSGRQSPSKSDRTSSSLSDSNRSVVSALSYQPSLRREGSKKSTPQISPPNSPTAATHGRKRSRSMGIGHKSGETSFPRLQAESQALLGGLPIAAPRPVSGGLLGSLRRAFGNNRNSMAGPERSVTIATNARPYSTGDSPQRSASLGAMTYTRHRQGAQDWDASASPTRSEHGEDGEDWDVESAVERRVVQVMFTVPRGSLRVVNAGPDGDNVSVADASVPLMESTDDAEKDKQEKEKEVS